MTGVKNRRVSCRAAPDSSPRPGSFGASNWRDAFFTYGRPACSLRNSSPILLHESCRNCAFHHQTVIFSKFFADRLRRYLARPSPADLPFPSPLAAEGGLGHSCGLDLRTQQPRRWTSGSFAFDRLGGSLPHRKYFFSHANASLHLWHR